MPHVVLTGSITPERAAAVLDPAAERHEGLILKLQGCYLATSGAGLLVEGLVVEGGKPHPLLARVDERPDGVVVRLSPLLDVEKTEGVQRFLAWTAQRIMRGVPGLAYGPTNLQAYLA